MNSRAATFYSDGLKLAGTVILPDDYKHGEKRPAVLICHGRFAIKEWVPSRWVPYLLEAGFICMVFDYRNLGESEGSPGTIIPQLEVRDVCHAITYLQQQPEVNADSIGLLGWGLGGGIAVSAAAKDNRIKAIVCASGVANGEAYGKVGLSADQWLSRQQEIRQDQIHRVMEGASRHIPRSAVLSPNDASDQKEDEHQSWLDSLVSAVGPERAADPAKLGIPETITLESMEALYKFAPDSEAGKIAPRPLLVIHSKEDHEFPIEHNRYLFEQAHEPKKFIEIVNAGHLDWIDPSHPAQKKYVPQVVQWLCEYLPVHA